MYIAQCATKMTALFFAKGNKSFRYLLALTSNTRAFVGKECVCVCVSECDKKVLILVLNIANSKMVYDIYLKKLYEYYKQAM